MRLGVLELIRLYVFFFLLFLESAASNNTTATCGLQALCVYFFNKVISRSPFEKITF